ncbi:MAG: acylhydrolase [Eubacterium sp.]|nr:acylhydrolase [Eubacterium sp.]
MKKVFKWIRKWFFLIVLVLTGSIYFVSTDSGQVYAKPLEKAEEWFIALINGKNGSEESVEAGSSLENSETIMVGSVSGNAVVENRPQGAWQEDVSGAEILPTQTPSMQKPTITSGDVSEGTKVEVTLPDEQPQKQEEPIFVNVEDDYFSDAVFIGDSRTVGLYEYGGLEETAAFYASTGLTIYKMFESPIVQVPGQKEKQTIEEALQENQFSKIYLMIGINEMGTGTVESFIETYQEAVAHLQELQPDAIIYLQAIMKVTTERSEQGDYIHNEGIEARNKEIAKLADNERIFYLDVNPLICDENGGMEASYTYDGVHLKAQYTTIWKDYLKTKAVMISSEN